MLNVRNLTSFSHLTFVSALAPNQMTSVIVVKAQYLLKPSTNANSTRSFELVQMVGAEEIYVTEEPFGELNKSSMRWESDLAPRKPQCDVIVIGSAHSPTGRPVKQVSVGIDVDSADQRILSHRLTVHGKRDFVRRDAFDRAAGTIVHIASFRSVRGPEWYLSDSEPFIEMPIRYEEAFGGELKIYPNDPAADRLEDGDKLADDVRKKHPEGEAAPIAHRTCRTNPVGQGYVEAWHIKTTRATRYPAPRIESPNHPVTEQLFDALARDEIKSGSQPALLPQGFGVISKPWQPRLKLAGTYDDAWRQQHWPYSPPDFDMAYWNGANPSMQCQYLRGRERVTLMNLLRSDAPGAQRENDATFARFQLPAVDAVLELRGESEPFIHLKMPIDTLTIDLEAMTVSLVWRTHIPDSMGFKEASLVAADLSELKLRSRRPAVANT